MTTQALSKGLCAYCGNTASLRCKGCTDADANVNEHKVTYCCSKICEQNDWASHLTACQAAQLEKVATKKLFRAGELLQEVFFATRMHTFDLTIAELTKFKDGRVLIREGPKHGPGPGSIHINGDSQDAAMVLSCCAGGDVLTGVMSELGKKVFEGYTAQIQEIDIEVQDSRILMSRQLEGSPLPPLSGERSHHIILVALKDGSKWAVDVAGAQHGQVKPVLRYAEYKRDYIAKVTDRRPYGTSALHPEYPICKRNTKTDLIAALPLLDNMSYQTDELEEWIFHNVTVNKILEADATEYQTLKESLVKCLATAAREYVKLHCKDPTSTAKPIYVITDVPEPTMSREDRDRMERKRARRVAEMDPSARKEFEDLKAKGIAVLMV